MNYLRYILCIQLAVLVLAAQNSRAQGKGLADAFVGGAPAAKAAPSTPASHRAAVEELFSQLNMAATVDQSVMQIAAALTGAAAEDGAYKDAVDAYISKYISWDAMKDEIAGLYMKAFTEKEINDLIAFYNTSTGRKLLAQSPEIGAKVAEMVHGRLVQHSAELKQMMMETDFKAFKDALSDDTPPEDQR